MENAVVENILASSEHELVVDGVTRIAVAEGEESGTEAPRLTRTGLVRIGRGKAVGTWNVLAESGGVDGLRALAFVCTNRPLDSLRRRVDLGTGVCVRLGLGRVKIAGGDSQGLILGVEVGVNFLAALDALNAARDLAGSTGLDGLFKCRTLLVVSDPCGGKGKAEDGVEERSGMHGLIDGSRTRAAKCCLAGLLSCRRNDVCCGQETLILGSIETREGGYIYLRS